MRLGACTRQGLEDCLSGGEAVRANEVLLDGLWDKGRIDSSFPRDIGTASLECNSASGLIASQPTIIGYRTVRSSCTYGEVAVKSLKESDLPGISARNRHTIFKISVALATRSSRGWPESGGCKCLHMLRTGNKLTRLRQAYVR